jgi:hypothetical protein
MSENSNGRKIKIRREQLRRFNFGSIDKVQRIKEKIRERPELRSKLKENFVGTIREEGIEIDREFLEKTREKWRAQVQEDIERKMARRPPSKKRYYKLISEGKPLKLRVKIDPAVGEKTVNLREEE